MFAIDQLYPWKRITVARNREPSTSVIHVGTRNKKPSCDRPHFLNRHTENICSLYYEAPLCA